MSQPTRIRFLSTGVIGLALVLGAPAHMARAQCETTELQTLTAPEPLPNGLFGYSISISEDTAFIGAPIQIARDDRASVFVFSSDGHGWNATQQLRASDSQSEDHFGWSIAVEGNWAIVGAWNSGNSGWREFDGPGAAYVFHFNGNAWEETAKLTASDGILRGWFGFSVDISGDVIVVGALRSSTHQGAAYVYRFNGTSWIEEAKFDQPDVSARSFGLSVATNGQTVVVGASTSNALCPDTPECRSGAVYVFRCPTAKPGVWMLDAVLFPSQAGVDDRFGFDMSMAGDSLIIGAPYAPVGDQFPGVAYVFELDGVEWLEQAKLAPIQGTNASRFGVSVSIDGNVAVVGEGQRLQDCSDASPCPPGSAHVFRAQNNQWVGVIRLISSGALADDSFGQEVAVGREVVIVGAASDSRNVFRDGAAYVFEPLADCDDDLLPDACEPEVAERDCDRNGVCNGVQIAECPPDDAGCVDCNNNAVPDGCEPDCNGNSIADACDIASGASRDCQPNGVPDDCESDCDRDGVPNDCESLVAEDDCDLDGVCNGQRIEACVTGDPACGDCNSNGIPDECDISSGFSVDENQNATPDECEPFCATTETLVLDVPPVEDIDSFGASVALDQDVLVVGAPSDSELDTAGGAVYVYRLVGGRWQLESKLFAADGAGFESFGNSVSVSGDVIVVGKRLDDDVRIGSGAAYIFGFNGLNWIQEAKLVPSSLAVDTSFGESVWIDGGVVVVGATRALGGASSISVGYVFRDDGSGWIQEAVLVPSDGVAQNARAAAVSMDGDTIVLGAVFAEGLQIRSGAAYVFRLAGTGWTEVFKLMASDGATWDGFGTSVGIQGGQAVIGSPRSSNNCPGALTCASGAVYVFDLNDTTAVQSAKLSASDARVGDNFGGSLVIRNGVIVAGSLSGSTQDPGSAYVFRFNGVDWEELSRFEVKSDDELLVAQIGRSVALGEGVVVLGSPGRQFVNSGVFIFAGVSDCNGNDALDICDISEGVSADCNTNGLPDECDALGMLNLPLDIKPGVCPNRLNLAGQGRLAVALLGSASFDASQVDPFSITLSRADCLGGQVSPVEGPPGPWSVLRDVATPFDGVGSPVCTSHDAAADGFADLFMHFDSQDVVNVLNLYSLPPGEVVELTVRGSLWDGTPFVGADRVRLLIPAMPIKIGLRNPATR